LNCPWHPNKRVVAYCKECGAGFCIECVRETDQTTLCPDCYRRKLGEIAREFAEPEEVGEGRSAEPASAPTVEKAPEPLPEVSPFDNDELPGPAATPETPPAEKVLVRDGAGASGMRRRPNP
jgi:hypothetical protein